MNSQLLLQEISAITKKYALLDQKTGGRFNIFEIVNVSTNEVAICRVLYELLSPMGSHFQSNTYLRLFAERVLGLYIPTSELASARVYREYRIDDARRIDLVIETSARFIPIEVKIYASNQPEQCYDYYIEAKKHMKAPTLYYLTRFGNIPSENSTKGLTKVETGYAEIKTISFAEDILGWLNLCITEASTLKISPIREIILQFATVIRQFTSQMEADIEMEIKELLLKSSENMRSAIAIQNSLSQAKEDFLKRLFNAIDVKVGKTRLVNEFDYAFDNFEKIHSTSKRNSQCPGISYLHKSNVKHMVDVWVRMAVEGGVLYVGYFCPENQKGGKLALSDNEIQTILGVQAWIDGGWVYWEICPNENDVTDFININEAYLDLLNEKNFSDFVDASAEKILSLLNN